MTSPPREKNFKAHLEWHLFVNGTRPKGHRERWTKGDFASRLEEIRDKVPTHKEATGNVRRSLNQWLSGTSICNDYPWGFAVDQAFFGPAGEHPAYDTWRALLHQARTARPQEAHRSALYVSEPVPGAHGMTATLAQELNRQGWRIHRADRGEGCTYPEFNKELVLSRPVIRMSVLGEPWFATSHYDADLEGFVLAEVGRKTGDYSNDEKVRVSSDFIGRDAVDLRKTDYLSSLMTDQLGWMQVRSTKLRQDQTPEHILRDLGCFVDDYGRLKGYAENSISNQLGASTLAFSSDGYLTIVVQNDKNLQSKDWLAPSGSGSFDWGDVEASGSSEFIGLVEYGAQRELREECALDDAGGDRAIPSKVRVIGFAKMLHRAGKPEFYCLGYMDGTAAEIRNRKPERYVAQVVSAEVGRVDFASKHPTEDMARICSAYLGKRAVVPLSYPLEHGLHLLLEACADERTAPILDGWCREKI